MIKLTQTDLLKLATTLEIAADAGRKIKHERELEHGEFFCRAEFDALALEEKSIRRQMAKLQKQFSLAA